MGEVARNIPQISAALDNHQADFQPSMIEVEGKILEKPVSILIDSGSTLSYISPKLVDLCKMRKYDFEKSWLVQLATGTKRKVTSFISSCEVHMQDLITKVDLNVLPLGSYDVLIGMDWLEKHKVVLNCFEKTFDCIDENGESKMVRGIPKKILTRKISALQLKKCARKGCRVFAVHITETNVKETKPNLEDLPFLNDFKDVFPEEILGLPPRRDIDFTIELIPGAVPASKAPYRMNTPELVELKLQLQ